MNNLIASLTSFVYLRAGGGWRAMAVSGNQNITF